MIVCWARFYLIGRASFFGVLAPFRVKLPPTPLILLVVFLFFRIVRDISRVENVMCICTMYVGDANLIPFFLWLHHSYSMKHFTMCATKHIVYLITCPCKKQYVGRTIRTFSIRVNEHIAKIKKGCIKHSVPHHYLEFHDKDLTGTSFQIIDKFVPHRRGRVLP